MSTTPVQLDFSKAQPVAQQTAGGGVSLDFTKAQPVATNDALNTAASTVAKPAPDVINDDSYNLAGTAYSVVAPPDPQKAHPDFHANFVKDANGKWQLQMTYPAGQRAMDPVRAPENSVDDQGNIYHRGNKIEVMGEPLIPAAPLLAAAKAAPALTRAAIASDIGQEAVKAGGKYLAKAVGVAGLGAAGAIGVKMAKKWLGSLLEP